MGDALFTLPPSEQETAATLTAEPVGLLAAWGDFPLRVAQSLKRQGKRIICLGVRNHADPALARHCDVFAWTGVAHWGYTARFFKRHGVETATMAGKIHKVLIYQPWLILRHLPDWETTQTLWPYFITMQHDRKDDTMLGLICDFFARRGITFQPATNFAPDLLQGPKQLTQLAPTEDQWKDIAFGWEIARELGRMDIGQCVAVKDRAVLALEAIEGTDQCIARAGGLCAVGNLVVVKVAKPAQDMRFDVPTVGLKTLEAMVKARARVLAIEAHKTIILDEPALVEYANRHRLVIVSVTSAEIASRLSSRQRQAA